MPRQWKERRATPGAWQFMQGRWHKADARGEWRPAEPPQRKRGGLSA